MKNLFAFIDEASRSQVKNKENDEYEVIKDPQLKKKLGVHSFSSLPFVRFALVAFLFIIFCSFLFYYIILIEKSQEVFPLDFNRRDT